MTIVHLHLLLNHIPVVGAIFVVALRRRDRRPGDEHVDPAKRQVHREKRTGRTDHQ